MRLRNGEYEPDVVMSRERQVLHLRRIQDSREPGTEHAERR